MNFEIGKYEFALFKSFRIFGLSFLLYKYFGLVFSELGSGALSLDAQALEGVIHFLGFAAACTLNSTRYVDLAFCCP